MRKDLLRFNGAVEQGSRHRCVDDNSVPVNWEPSRISGLR